MRLHNRCEKGHDFYCKKCGMSFDERIKELGNDGLENMGIIMDKLRKDM